MARKFSYVFSASAALFLMPGVALADVSSQDVWGSFQKYMESFGYEISPKSVDLQGDRLIVRDVILAYQVPEVNMQASIEKLEFQERSDGSVVISMSNDVPFSMSADAESNAEMDITMIMRQSGLDIIASGQPDDIQYEYSASELNVDFDKFFIEGEKVSPEMDIVVAGISGSARVIEGDGWNISGSSTADKFTLNMEMDIPDEADKVNMSLQVNDIKSTSTAVYPYGLDWSDPSASFAPGVSANAVMSNGPTAFVVSVTGNDFFEMSSTAISSDFSVSVQDGSVQYGGKSSDNKLAISTDAMPFGPTNISIEQSAFDMLVPMGESQEPKDFRVLLNILNLDVDEMLWSMFDPGNQLPRDPVNLTVDLEGKARATGDLLDPEILPEDMEMPFDLDVLTVNELSLSLAGAEVIGRGEFEFDSEDTETFGGLPAPSGELGVDLYGINTLLETLGNMGLLPPEQAMGAQMMMGMFARPAEGDDHLSSDIEVRGDGSVFVNGQQMR